MQEFVVIDQFLSSDIKPLPIFITGAALDDEVMDFIKTSGAEVIEKPFSPAAVRHVVQRVLSDS